MVLVLIMFQPTVFLILPRYLVPEKGVGPSVCSVQRPKYHLQTLGKTIPGLSTSGYMITY